MECLEWQALTQKLSLENNLEVKQFSKTVTLNLISMVITQTQILNAAKNWPISWVTNQANHNLTLEQPAMVMLTET